MSTQTMFDYRTGSEHKPPEHRLPWGENTEEIFCITPKGRKTSLKTKKVKTNC